MDKLDKTLLICPLNVALEPLDMGQSFSENPLCCESLTAIKLFLYDSPIRM
jgi:hypothetical protein